jgi:predicted TPR repeat methyltransferase
MARRNKRPPSRAAAPPPPPPRPAIGGLSGTLLRMAGQAAPVAPDFAAVEREIEQGGGAPIAQMFGLLRHREQLARRLAECQRAAEAEPDSPVRQLLLGDALRHMGKRDEAIAAYRRCLELEPRLAPARHFLAALGAEAVPPAMPHQMVAGIFDGAAASFERELVGKLKYQAPALIEKTLAPHLPELGRGLDVMDAGCGTGLCAPYLRRIARRLDGVDLSAAMIEQATAKVLYDRLGQGDLCDALARMPGDYDLVVAADVLLYLGDLAPVFAAARTALRPRGLFAFTVERGTGGSYALTPSGRYTHDGAYVEAEAARAGFALLERVEDWLRFEEGKPVGGLVYVFARS